MELRTRSRSWCLASSRSSTQWSALSSAAGWKAVTGMQELQSRKDTFTLEMQGWNEKLSNCSKKVSTVIVIASKISSLWSAGNLDIKCRIQNLVFPEGLYWDKQISDYQHTPMFSFAPTCGRFFISSIIRKNAASGAFASEISLRKRDLAVLRLGMDTLLRIICTIS